MRRPHPIVIIAVMLICLLPSVAVGATWACLASLGVVPAPGAEIGILETAEYLGGKSVSYWFIALAVVAIGSWSAIVRWLLQQYDSQRADNAALVKELVQYMKTDHAEFRVVLEGATAALKANGDVLTRVLDRLGH